MRVAFFIEDEWAFGNIHFELMKYLHSVNVDAIMMKWAKHYSHAEFVEYEKQIDFLVTISQAVPAIIGYNVVPLEKIIVIFHSDLDIIHYLTTILPEHQQKIGKLGAVSKWLVTRANELNVGRTVTHLPLGVNYKRYHNPISNELKTIGYAGAFTEREGIPHEVLNNADSLYPNGWGPNLYKRAYLIKEIAEELGLNFVIAQKYHNSFVTMPGFYANVDCIMVASLREGASLPMLESGPSGKLLLTTNVGHFEERVTNQGAIVLPFDEAEYKAKALQALKFYVDNPKEYRKACAHIQEHAKTYDWSNVIHHWVDFFNSKE